MRELLLGRGLWAALMIAVLLSGYSYIQAVQLYGQASQAAENSPELGRGLSPLDGILVPTFGGLYLISTLLYPFVVIRTLGAEKQSGALQLLLQLPYSLSDLLGAKLAAAVVAWVMLVSPCLIAIGVWRFQGGHVGTPETANLILGHFLFALVIAGISLAAAATTRRRRQRFDRRDRRDLRVLGARFRRRGRGRAAQGFVGVVVDPNVEIV